MENTEEWQPPKDIKPWIVCAANKCRDHVILGARHWDNIMHQQQLAKQHADTGQHWIWEQGFIDQWGRFYNRKDAMKAVLASGQPFNAERNSGNGEDLYSEGLY